MAKRSARVVQCYHCRHRFEVSGMAQSTSCPSCHKRLIVEDMIINNLVMSPKVETCGKIVVQKRGRIISNSRIIASEGLEVIGNLSARDVFCGGQVIIGPKATWKGNLQAPSLIIADGARITSGYFNVPVDPLEMEDLIKRGPP